MENYNMEPYMGKPNGENPKKNPKTKKWLRMVIVALVIVGVLSGCAFGLLYPPYRAAKDAYEAGNYESTVNKLQNYLFDTALYVKACCKLGEQHLDEGSCGFASGYMSRVAGDKAPKAVRKAAQECVKNGDYSTALSCVSLLDAEDRTELLNQLGQQLLDTGNQEQADIFLGKNGHTPGMIYPYSRGLREIARGDLEEAKIYLLDSGDFRDAEQTRNLIDTMLSKDYAETAQIIRNIPDNGEVAYNTAEEWVEILNETMSYNNDTDAANYLSAKALIRSLQEQPPFDPSVFPEILDESLTNLVSSIGGTGRSQEITIPSLQHICDISGSDPRGKILVVKEYPLFGTEEVTSVLSYDVMQYLPWEYLPESVDEVSYVITITYGYMQIGYYSGPGASGGDALQEFAYITAYSLETGEYVYMSELVLGDEPPESIIAGSGVPKKYTSGGIPDTSVPFLEALEAVMAME